LSLKRKLQLATKGDGVDKFTINELARVDQEQFRDELFVLRHSPAACKIFANAQYHLAFCEGYEGARTMFFMVAYELFNAINELACDVAHSHMLRYSRWNPNRLWLPGVGKFMRLAEELGNEVEHDDYGETYIRTICGWWKV
jgi:hypothetical protein